MDNTLLLSLAIPAVGSLMGVFFEKKTLTLKLALSALILGGLVFAYMDTYKNNAENEKYRKAEKESQEILKNANEQIGEQAVVINKGFANLNSQLSAAGINDLSLLSSMRDLKTQVAKLSTDSKKYFSQVIKVVNVRTVTSEGGEDTFRISFGDKNSVSIDRMNQFTVSNEQTDEQGKIRIRMNGRNRRLAPGEYVQFQDQFKQKKKLVYRGAENGASVFYIQPF